MLEANLARGPQFEVDLCRDADIPHLLAIQAKCYHPTLLESATSFRGKLIASPDTCFLVRSPQGVAGYLITLPIHNHTLPLLNASGFVVPEGANTLYVHDLAVDPASKGRGLGRMLLDAAFREAGRKHLTESCLVAVQQSDGFWATFGYRVDRALSPELQIKLKTYGEDALFMRKKLP